MRITILLIIITTYNLLGQGKAIVTLKSGSEKEVIISSEKKKSISIINENGKTSKIDRKLIASIKYNEGENLNLVDGIYEFSKVDSVYGATASELFLKANEWVALAYKSAQSVIQLNSPETNTLIVKGNFIVGRGQRVGHTIKIQTRDGRYKFTCNQLETLGQYGMSFEGKVLGMGIGKPMLRATALKLQTFSSDLHKHLSSKSKTEEDW